MTNSNQVNWDEIPEDVEAVITFELDVPTYIKGIAGNLLIQNYRQHGYGEISCVGIDYYRATYSDRFHLRPSPITQPTPEPPESTQVESSEVEDTTTPEFDWSSVDDDVEAVIVSPIGHLMAVLKECDGVLLIGGCRGIKGMYPTRRANTIDKYPLVQLGTGDGILIRRPPATTSPDTNMYDIYKEAAIKFKPDADMYDIFKGVDSKPSISTILQEAQQSILKHHGVTGKVKFTVTCSE